MNEADPAPSIPSKHSVPGTAAIRMLLGEGVPNTDPVWAGIGEFGWYVRKLLVRVCKRQNNLWDAPCGHRSVHAGAGAGKGWG